MSTMREGMIWWIVIELEAEAEKIVEDLAYDRRKTNGSRWCNGTMGGGKSYETDVSQCPGALIRRQSKKIAPPLVTH